MEDRYEIRGKIGQGGLGSVYRAFDRKMNREVAIKRITAGMDDGLAEESTRQLLKEAGALASLQHPHIVTVHDFGSDEDGPYVVMELIAGKTLDEIIVHSPLTWQDFKELALQTQEALIAAQDLDLIHSDLKPSNLMLTWLPSGKFQVKVVDFGLAVLSQSQCRKEIEAMDTVFGSIFFMPPEQFERKPLDSRSDLYSIGCVYYQALTSRYPFRGKTGNEVMQSHLKHAVIPLHELRDDIPQWACDWVMWHINRKPEERPESAREALATFLKQDKIPNPVMSQGRQSQDEPKRPKLIIPGGTSATPTGPLASSTPSQPLVPPTTRSEKTTPASLPSSPPASPEKLPPKPGESTTSPASQSSSPQSATAAKPSAPSTDTPAQPSTKPETSAPAATPGKTSKDEISSKTEPLPSPTDEDDIPVDEHDGEEEDEDESESSESEGSDSSSTRSKTYSRPKLVLPKRASDPINPLGRHKLRATPSQPDNSPTAQQPVLPPKVTPPPGTASSAVSLPPLTAAQLTVARSPLPTITSSTTPQQVLPLPTVPVSQTTDLVSTLTSPVSALTSPVATVAAPQPLQPPVGAKPSIHANLVGSETQAHATLVPAGGQPTAILSRTGPHAAAVMPHMGGASVTVSTSTGPRRKTGVSNAAKAMIATAITILIVIMGWVLMERMRQNREAETLNDLVTKAAKSNATELPITKADLELLLASASNVSFNQHRAAIYKALLIAKSTDGTEVDNIIAKYVTSREMLAEVKETLIRDVLRMRKNPQIVPTLLGYATTTGDARGAIASLQAIRFMVEDKHFEAIVRTIQNTTNPDVRRAAEETAAEIIRKSSNKAKLSNSLSTQYGTSLNTDIRYSLLRLLGACGGEKATATVKEIMNSGENQQIIAALSALAAWGDDSGFPMIVDFIKQSRDPVLRSRAFDAAHRFLGGIKDGAKQAEYWGQLATEAKTRDEQIKVLNGIAYLNGDWALELVGNYVNSSDERVQAMAEKVRDDMLERRKLNE